MADTTLFPSLIPGDDREDDQDAHDRAAIALENGACPWCDEYSGESVAQHASSAHPDEWRAYQNAQE